MSSAKARDGRAVATFGVLAVVAAAATVLLTHASPEFDDPLMRGAMAMVVGVAALGATWLALLRSVRTRLVADLALACGIGLVALNSTLLVALAGVGAPGSAGAVEWLPVPSRIAGGLLLVAAGRSTRELRRLRPSALGLAGAVVVASLCMAAAGAGFGSLRGGSANVAPAQIASIVIYLAAALALAERARRSGERALWYYAGAVAGLAVTRALFWLQPPSGPDYVSSGDIVRMLIAAMLLAAVWSELAELRLVDSAVSVAGERRRMAREFHDGLAQELAFIVSQSRRALAGKSDEETLELLADAGQMALLDARQAIFKLNRRRATMLSTAIVEHTMRIAERAGLTLDVEVDGEVPVDHEAEHEIVRIVGEAVSNAAKHANATHVSVGISSERGRVIVRISDDGDGFDVAAQRSRRGFGLVSMSERTRSLGGRLHLESTPGEGTVIEVAI